MSKQPKTGKPEQEKEQGIDEAGNAKPAKAGDDGADVPQEAAGADVPQELTPRPPSKAGTGLLALLWVVVVLGVLGGTGYATWPIWSPYLTAYIPTLDKEPPRDPRVAGVSDRVKALETQAETRRRDIEAIKDLEAERARFSKRLGVLIERVETLEDALGSVREMIEATTLPSDAAVTNESLQRLSERLARLEEDRSASSEDSDRLELIADERRKLSTEVSKIIGRLATLEKTRTKPVGTAGGAKVALLAVGQLREALRVSSPFTGELQALRKVAGSDQGMMKALDVLEPYAATGTPTLASLRAGFESVAGMIVGAARTLEGEGWMARTVNRLSSLVTVRRVDEAPDDHSLDAVVARAETSLKAGDLMAAVKTLEGLSGAPGEAAAPWLEGARARLAAERAMATLHVIAVSLLSPGDG